MQGVHDKRRGARRVPLARPRRAHPGCALVVYIIIVTIVIIIIIILIIVVIIIIIIAPAILMLLLLPRQTTCKGHFLYMYLLAKRLHVPMREHTRLHGDSQYTI